MADMMDEKIEALMRPLLFEAVALSVTWGQEGAWTMVERRVKAALAELGMEDRIEEIRCLWLGKPRPGEILN